MGLVNTRIKKSQKNFATAENRQQKHSERELTLSCKACAASDHPELHSPGFAISLDYHGVAS
jgi:hypothetical protein